MSLEFFVCLVVAVLLMCAVIPARAAMRTRSLRVTDIVIVLGPPPVFVAAVLAFNKPAQIGWALIGYPFLILAASVVTLFLRVYVLSEPGSSSRRVSALTALAAILGAAAFGAFVPPWHE
jgi:hypothetical protein